uniref:Uncharacterized protein n=1 Tax=Sphaerodactylus townsendi TaxID=933632 RepID=A0ACB8F0Q9_9SAUR
MRNSQPASPLINGSLSGSSHPSPQDLREVNRGSKSRLKRRSEDQAQATPKCECFTCRILDVSERHRLPRNGERALSDCGHFTRIPGRAATTNRITHTGRGGQWAWATESAEPVRKLGRLTPKSIYL